MAGQPRRVVQPGLLDQPGTISDWYEVGSALNMTGMEAVAGSTRTDGGSTSASTADSVLLP